VTDSDIRTNPDNFCYRHPDRQSFVLCQRCLRTICGSARHRFRWASSARSASPSSARRRQGERHADAAAPRGADIDGNPVVTYTLIVIVDLLLPDRTDPGRHRLSFRVARLPRAAGVHAAVATVTTLVHASIFHIAFNMLALWALGRSLEPLLGRWRFLALYLLSALGGSVLTALLAPTTWVVGASGAVWGLLGAMFVIGRHLGANVTAIAVLLGSTS
jgi:hypothetical protein